MVHMSRGLGPTQRRLLAIISQGVDGEFVAFEISYLKSLVGGDRSNLRRAIRGLLRRNLIRERIEGGRRYYALTLWGCLFGVPLDPVTAPKLPDDALKALVLSLNHSDPMNGAKEVRNGPSGAASGDQHHDAERGKRSAKTGRRRQPREAPKATCGSS